MTKGRWMGVILIALAFLLVPAILWNGSRRAEGVERGEPAAQQNDDAPAVAGALDEEPEGEQAGAAMKEALLYVFAEHGSALAVVDAGSGRVKHSLPAGVAAPDGARLYTVEHRGRETRVQAVEPGTGRVMDETSFEGDYTLPWMGPTPGGLSANGRWLAVQSLPNPPTAGGGTSRFVVLDTSFAEAPRTVEVRGYFEFDALSDDGTALYLVEYTGEGQAFERYRVRRYDLVAGFLDEAVVVDKTNPTEQMSGFRVAALPSHDGRWLYSLYFDYEHGSHFLHALNVAEGRAVCIDLDDPAYGDENAAQYWGLALSPGGETLYMVNGALRLAVELDTEALAVRRTVKLARAESGLGSFLARLAGRLLPAAQAKVGVVNPVILTADGATLLALGLEGILVVDVADLATRAHYLPDRRLTSMALSHDGTVLYALSPEPSQLLQVDTTTGQILATTDGDPSWWGLVPMRGSAR